MLVFLSKAADLTAVVEEKEQTLQEKTEVILQKEQEIFQLKKGEEFSPVEPSDLLPPGAPARKWPRQEAAWSHLADSAPPTPGLGHDSALSQMHQLQSELEALQSLRAEEAEAAAADDVLRLPSPDQGLALSGPEPHVSPHRSRRPGVVATVCAAAGHVADRCSWPRRSGKMSGWGVCRGWNSRKAQLVLTSSGLWGRSLPCALASCL